jgi:hypothetical protein
MGPGSTRRVQVRSRAFHNHRKRIGVPGHLEGGLIAGHENRVCGRGPGDPRLHRFPVSIAGTDLARLRLSRARGAELFPCRPSSKSYLVSS